MPLAFSTGCPNCELRLRGYYHRPMVVSNRYKRPSFCDGCGIAYPWATREERIYELENLLDEADIDEADRVVIQDQLQRVRNAGLAPQRTRCGGGSMTVVKRAAIPGPYGHLEFAGTRFSVRAVWGSWPRRQCVRVSSLTTSPHRMFDGTAI